MGKDQELLEAARNGNLPVVEKILGQRAKRSGPLASLRRGPGANVQDSSGYSALHHAALNGHRDIVRLLLEHDASTNIVDDKGSSPLHLASWSGNVDIVRLLLCGPSICNVNLTTKDSETALHCAAQYGHTGVVGLLLEHACDPAIRNSRGETALDLAAQYGRLETVELLVRTHPALTQPMQRAIPGIVFRHTPLHLASRNGHKAVVEILLRAGFDVNIRTRAGTALHEAALCGKVEVVRTLVEHGTDLSIRDDNHYTVKDLLRQFPAHATQDIMFILERHRRSSASILADSDIESESMSISQPFPPVPNSENTLGSPYENVRPSSRGRSFTTEPSPGTSPSRWDFYRQARSIDGCEDRRTSGTSAMSMRKSRLYKSLPIGKRNKNQRSPRLPPLNDHAVLDITFSFSQQLQLNNLAAGKSQSPFSRTSSCYTFRGSDNSVYQTPPAPKQFMDCHSEDIPYLYPGGEADQISVSSTTSSTSHSRRLDYAGVPLYMPMNARSVHSPGSNNKVSPTPPKKPPRRNLSVSPTHLQPMSASVDGVSNSAYEYLFLARSGAKSQNDLLDDMDSRRDQRLKQARSVDQYVEMNAVFNIALDEEDEYAARAKELQRGYSEDMDGRRSGGCRLEPVAITSMYENMVIKQQNPKRKLRRPLDHRDVYEEYDFKTSQDSSPVTSSSAPSTTYVSTAVIMVKDDRDRPESDGHCEKDERSKKSVKLVHIPLSPTHYQQPPTPEHPPPSAIQAENSIHDRIRPLSQEYKRRSRDMETETEEEFLVLGDESSGSFSSSVSLSDRSVSTDNHVEEYVADVPFAGLFKGSTKALETVEDKTKPIPVERPKTLQRLKNVYENVNKGQMRQEDTEKKISSLKANGQTSCDKDSRDRESTKDSSNLSILSPFDEQEEWAKIQEIMASFGTGIVRESVFVSELEREFQNRFMGLSFSHGNLNSVVTGTVEKWLESLDMGDYESLFIHNGFDDIDYLNGVLQENDLKDMGINSELERQLILEACKQLPLKVHEQPHCNNNNLEDANDTVDDWLKRIHLEQYSETFAKHLYLDMDRIRRIWDVELSAVLEIEKIGHRKRILASVSGGDRITPGPKLEDINAELHMLNSNIQQLKADIKSPSIQNSTGTGTLRHRHKKSRPAPPPPVAVPPKNNDLEIRAPSELCVGGGHSLKTQWRHQPITLITSAVKYISNYLGSTTIKELRGTDSTKKSIQKLKKSQTIRTDQEIILSISYKGVKFIHPRTQVLICEHEIRNIHCACQDTEDLSYFAYITKDQNNHYCHVFCTKTTELATEIILTLGQAFEVAYQMALREQVTSKTHKSSFHHQQPTKPAASPGAVSSHSRDFKESPTCKQNDLLLNGHPLKMAPLTLSLAEPLTEPSRTPTKAATMTLTEELQDAHLNEMLLIEDRLKRCRDSNGLRNVYRYPEDTGNMPAEDNKAQSRQSPISIRRTAA